MLEMVESEERNVLRALIAFEAHLYSTEVEQKVVKLPQAEKQKFVDFRLTVGNKVAEIKNAVLKKISDQFRQILPDLKQGIANLQNQLDSVERIANTFEQFAPFLDILDKFIGLVI